jgi:thymidylate synthase (FAD)
MGSDAHLAAAAWVSTSSDEGMKRAVEKPDDVSGVINYLMKHRHGTPFEHSAITFYVHAPIFVWREWHRHRIGFSYNEESARYKVLDPVFYVPVRDRPMMKVEGWKPGRPKFLKCEYQPTYDILCFNLKEGYEAGYRNYLNNLELGIDPGLARDCLPVGIYSSCWVSCNPRSLMAFLSLRTQDENSKFLSYPLYEIEVAARQVEELLKHYWPITYDAFNKNGRVAP